MKEKVALFFSILIPLTSCDPFVTLRVSNTTDKEKHIEVVGIYRDSIPLSKITDNNKVKSRNTIAVELKAFDKAGFYFMLAPKHEALLEFGFGSRPATDQIIINETDTVNLRKSAGRVKKKPYSPIGGNYVLTLKN